MFVADEARWAKEVFGKCQLGDPRRKRRLVKYAALQAKHARRATYSACEGDSAAVEGAYRLLRNPNLEPKAIREGGFASTAEKALGRELIVAAEDTTTISYTHDVAEELGDVGGPSTSQVGGWHVHSVLLLDGKTEETLGLVEQTWRTRDRRSRGKRHQRKERAYAEKESFKWQHASERVEDRLGEEISRVVQVCDREADVFEYLAFKQERGHRFVVRVSWDRRIVGDDGRLWNALAKAPVITKTKVAVSQRGKFKGRHPSKMRKARKARTATLSVRARTVTLKPPKNRSKGLEPLTVSVVSATEANPPKGAKPLKWILYTTEPIDSPEALLTILRLYSLRWRVEDFHKAWKTGCRLEQRRLQSPENLERLGSILSFVAVRLLQLRDLADDDPTRSCQEVLERDYWRCLWARVEKRKPPRKAPNMRWALHAIAKLGGWTDSKRTGRVGWQSLWRGWVSLDEMAMGWRLAFSNAGEPDL